jgi:bis(5'-nucleosyl)-tetraphosphatase (symmetrical)
MEIYAVGDIQGCYNELEQMLELVVFDKKKDQLWLVGDLVNRGADSLSVLRLVKSMGNSAITVLGNHDLHLLAVAAGVAELHHSDTLDEILQAPDRDELLTWLRHQRMLHVQDKYVLLHAGLLPEWSMRICTPQGEMQFKFKGEVSDVPAGYLPWFDVSQRASASATVVLGHWSALGLINKHNVIALDTGCLWGGALTAIRLSDRKIFQVKCSKQKTKKDWQ